MNHVQIGPYQVIRKLGEGGMGAVFECIHAAIERRVAIKVLHPEFAKNPEFTTRFFNEARAVNRVDHPGLVQISDYGQMPDGNAYIVMELLKGECVGTRLKRVGGPLGVEETLLLSRQIAEALAAAHAKGIVHRDLKPDNIMIVPDQGMPGGERTKLLDFGIAKISATDRVGPMTQTNAVMGTPVYMSPEQCRGAASVDEKSDVYSFGVLLYVMLSGRRPFDGEGTGEIMAKHIYEAPPPLAMHASWVPGPLVELVHALLVKDKQQRPKMASVVEALDGLAGELIAPAPRRSSTIRFRAFAGVKGTDTPTTLGLSTGQGLQQVGSRRRRLVSLAGAGCGLVLAAGVVWLSAKPRTSPQVHVAEKKAVREPVRLQAAAPRVEPIPQLAERQVRVDPPGAERVPLPDGRGVGGALDAHVQAGPAGDVSRPLRPAEHVPTDAPPARIEDVDVPRTPDVTPTPVKTPGRTRPRPAKKQRAAAPPPPVAAPPVSAPVTPPRVRRTIEE